MKRIVALLALAWVFAAVMAHAQFAHIKSGRNGNNIATYNGATLDERGVAHPLGAVIVPATGQNGASTFPPATAVPSATPTATAAPTNTPAPTATP